MLRDLVRELGLKHKASPWKITENWNFEMITECVVWGGLQNSYCEFLHFTDEETEA